MTEEAKNPELEQLKLTYNMFMQKLRLLQTPTTECQQLIEVLKNAAATNRMGTDLEFAKFVNTELAISVMQKLAKTASMDEVVSKSQTPETTFPRLLSCSHFCWLCVVYRGCG